MTNIVHLGNCMEGMAQYPDKWFDLAVVDPPYGIGEHGQRMNRTERWKNPGPIKYKRVQWDNKPPDSNYFIELKRVSKHQIIWGANHFLNNISFNISSPCWLIWDKKTAGDFADCELAWTSFNKATRIFEWLWSGFRKEEPETRIHPTQKPVALYDWIFANYLPNGGKVIDTHIGSGSSRISAYKRGNIDFTGYELDPDYHRDQEARFREFVMKVAPADLEPITKDGQIKLF